MGEAQHSPETEARRERILLNAEIRDLAKQLFPVSFMPGNWLCTDLHMSDEERARRCFDAAKTLLKIHNVTDKRQ